MIWYQKLQRQYCCNNRKGKTSCHTQTFYWDKLAGGNVWPMNNGWSYEHTIPWQLPYFPMYTKTLNLFNLHSMQSLIQTLFISLVKDSLFFIWFSISNLFPLPWYNFDNNLNDLLTLLYAASNISSNIFISRMTWREA